MKFNIIDGIVLVSVFFGMWRGFVAGLVREVMHLVGLFVAFALSMYLMKPFGLLLQGWVNIVDVPGEGGVLAAFAIVFVAVFSIFFILARLLERALSALKLGFVNQTLGGAFGGLKSAVVLSIVLVFIGQIGIPGKETRQDSFLYSSVENLAPQVWKVVRTSLPTAPELTDIEGSRFWE